MDKSNILNAIRHIPDYEVYGTVTAIRGMLIEASGLAGSTVIGSTCLIEAKSAKVQGEIIGFRDNLALLLPFTDVSGIGVGSKVKLLQENTAIYIADSWLGRIINAQGEPLDDKGPLPKGSVAYLLKNPPPPAQKRNRVGKKVDLGVKSINCFATCCDGQRMGIFSGSGVGKSVLISMLTKYANTDVKVIGLIGERGREVQEFVQDYLGEEGLKKAVVIVATSDESALLRRQAAYLTLSVSEYFRDQGKNVLCLMDSITRFAMAQREIGLAGGEPPTNKAYPPTVFSELPRLLERAGPGAGDQGSITGFFSVLVDGDDHNEPIADAVRGILDGHIVLTRQIAERGRYPAIDVLKSISRTMPKCNNDEETALIRKAVKYMSIYNDMAEMIRLGAYKAGSNKEVDEAISYYDRLEEFLSQKPEECFKLEDCYTQLGDIFTEKPKETK